MSLITTCIMSQQTTTRDFACSVSEFTTSTGSYHVNSPDSVNKCVSTHGYREIMSFSCDDTCQWNHTSSDPLRLMSNSFKTRDNGQNTCIHVNTHESTYWWSGTNYEPVWHVPTGSEMVPCLLGYLSVIHCYRFMHTPNLLKSQQYHNGYVFIF